MASASRRATFKASIMKISKFCNSITEDTDVFEIETNNDRLVDLWNKYEEVHLKIVDQTGEELIEFENIEFNDTESLVMTVFSKLRRCLQERKVQNNPDQNQSQFSQVNRSSVPGDNTADYSGLRVPRITIPEFSGKYLEWPSFRDLFMTMVGDNPKVPNVQKLSYLKKVVVGETAKLISKIKITSDNYQMAWDILHSRFENERIIVHELLNHIFEIPNADGSADAIKLILDTTTEALTELQNLNRPIEYYDDWLIFIIVRKLDKVSLEKWNELIGDDNTVLEYRQLDEFLKARFRILEGTNTESKGEIHSSKSSKNVLVSVTKNNNLKCYYCKGGHRAKSCLTFKRTQPKERRKIVESANLCINCLSPGHKSAECSSTRTCFKCGQHHHSLLHVDSDKTKFSKEVESTSSSSSSSSLKSAHHVKHITEKNQDILLATAVIIFKLDSGKIVKLRALLDQGSQMSLISTFAVKRLCLKSDPYTGVPLTGAGGEQITAERGIVNFMFHSRVDSFRYQTEALVLDTVSQYQRSDNNVLAEASKRFPHIQFADPSCDDSRIDVLLAADIYAQVIQEGVFKFCGILFQNTSLGWILSGQYQSVSDLDFQSLSIHHSSISMDRLIRSFWEIEGIPSGPKSSLTSDELACEKHFQQTHSRNSKGRFVVRLPFKLVAQQKQLGYSRGVAVSCQIRLENRFKKNAVLKEKYTAFMSESIQMGHMELVKADEIDKPANECFYLPHHAIFRDSQTTAIRIVFNASQKSSSGISLNDLLYTGPKLQLDLFNILTRFRKYRIGYMADIEKMYRRILIHRDDRNFQRILWRENSSEELRTYRMRVLTDGTSAAPFLAIRTIRQLATDEQSKYPLAHQTLMEDMFMDDMLSGSNDVLSGIEHVRQINQIIQSAGMRMRKWTSNVSDVLQEISEDDRQDLPIEFGQEDFVKVLGILWYPSSDCFAFKVRLPSKEETTTKRKLLSHASKLFDPLGFLAPCMIIPKILIQKLWELKINWDDLLPNEIKRKWDKFREQLPELENIRIPRCIGTLDIDDGCKYELHAFSDASKVAYSAVVYMRKEYPNGTIEVNLVAGKTKVAPVKKITIPCLELCGALLVSRLLQKIKISLKVDDMSMYGWTDSEIVLGWLNKSPGTWQQFVGNRTSQILDVLAFSQWNYVKSESNPADCASRGILPSQLLANSLWWNGPEWLRKDKSIWPSIAQPFNLSEIDLMKRKSIMNLVISDPRIEFLEQYSSLQKLIRMTAWCMRFVNNIRKRITERTLECQSSSQRVQALHKQSLHHGGPRKCRSRHQQSKVQISSDLYLKVDELRNALKLWIKIVQDINFAQELQRIKSNKSIRRGKLRKLNPKLDLEDGILRVGGRLTNAHIPFNQKHPIVLPKHNHLTSLILKDAHIKTLHGHVTLMLHYLRQTYWILGARQVIRHHVTNCCKICIKLSNTRKKQQMSDLPRPRVVPSRLFTHTGVDYAGPIYITNGRRGTSKILTKGYIAVFICLATKVVHLEAAENYSTREFIETFKRFTSRRAIPKTMYSDNGSNFVGATTELTKAQQRAMKEQYQDIASQLANDGVEWEFNPPSGSHFGGIYEAGVKSMKYHLKRVLGSAHLTFKEVQTVLCQIECALNSRPLCAMTDDVDDLNFLTPGHFVAGTALTSLPEESLLNINENRLVRWQRTQQIFQNFWKHWSTEYLSGLQNRSKWFTEEDNLKVGELVILKDDNTPPTKWLMGRVIKLHPGQDGLVRVVTLRFGSNCSILTRPIHKLCRLPFLKSNELDYGF